MQGGATLWTLLVIAALILAGAIFWWVEQKDNRLSSQINSSQSQAKSTAQPVEGSMRQELSALAASLKDIRQEKAALLAELSHLRRQVQSQLQLVKSAHAQAGAAPTVDPAGRALVGKVTFAPGSAKVEQAAVHELSRIAARLAQKPGARVLVQGAADTTPMGAHTAARHGDNAGLAMARALSVFRALKSLGVEQGRMSMRAAGKAEEGGDAGRTVEVWLVPAS